MTETFSRVCSEAIEAHMQPDLFRALCDPVRVALVAHLATMTEPVTVTEASSCCGIHFSGVSRHLAILKGAGVVVASKRGREVYYELAVDKLTATLRGLADALDQCRASAAADIDHKESSQ